MSIAKKIEGFISQSSMIRRMFEEGIELKKQFGPHNVYDFSLGNPDVPPPAIFKETLGRIVAEEMPGKHAYMPNAGYPATRQAIAGYLSGIHGMDINTERIVMTCGAGGALNVIFKTLLDPGDEVLVPTPCFVEYGFYADNAGGKIKFITSNEDFSLNLHAIEQGITERTKAILINSPNNPTGKVYDEASIAGLAAILVKKSNQLGKTIYLVSDEPYSDIVFDGVIVPSIFKAYPHSIIASSYSKTLSLAGERIGYIAVHPDIKEETQVMGGLILCNRMLGFVNAPALMQRVVEKLQGITVDVDIYRRKRDLFCDGLTAQGYDIVKPEGAFYLFPKTPIPDDVTFVQTLKKYRILTVPGSGFIGPGHFRIAYCVDDDKIINSMEGFGKAMREFR
ncbi:MAG: Aspartate/prephenate aminotransferase [Syntrophus sp. SKADARSKE-3]|nr:Aspartate/prephenate aminotransferase [Syntrophus sp. SKADARSKE-3]